MRDKELSGILIGAGDNQFILLDLTDKERGKQIQLIKNFLSLIKKEFS